MMGKKKGDATPGEKLLALFTYLLFNNRETSLKELAEKLDCSKQTIGRLISQLEAAAYGKVLAEKRGREIFYSLARSKNLPQLALDAEGLAQLALCRDFMINMLPEAMSRKIGATLNLASAFLPPGQAAPPEIGFSLSRGAVNYAPHLEKLETLRRAIMEGLICAVEYEARRGLNKYDFAPKKLLAYQGSLRVLGWLVDNRTPARAKFEKPTALALQRFKKVEPRSKSSAHLPNPPTPEGVFGLMNDELFTAAVRFQSEAAVYVAEREWSADQVLDRRSDGSLILKFTARSPLEVLAWVLGFGAQAEILAPDWLLEDMKESVKELAKVYGL